MTTNKGQSFAEWITSLTEQALYEALRLSFITCGEYNREQDRRRLEQLHRQAEGHAPTASEAAADHLTEWRQRIIAGRS